MGSPLDTVAAALFAAAGPREREATSAILGRHQLTAEVVAGWLPTATAAPTSRPRVTGHHQAPERAPGDRTAAGIGIPRCAPHCRDPLWCR